MPDTLIRHGAHALYNGILAPRTPARNALYRSMPLLAFNRTRNTTRNVDARLHITTISMNLANAR
eukprot:4025391-Lingulodinium_polyedra.AAC.1